MTPCVRSPHNRSQHNMCYLQNTRHKVIVKWKCSEKQTRQNTKTQTTTTRIKERNKISICRVFWKETKQRSEQFDVTSCTSTITWTAFISNKVYVKLRKLGCSEDTIPRTFCEYVMFCTSTYVFQTLYDRFNFQLIRFHDPPLTFEWRRLLIFLWVVNIVEALKH